MIVIVGKRIVKEQQYSLIAQLAERSTVNRNVPGSSPGGGAMLVEQTSAEGCLNTGTRCLIDLGKLRSWFDSNNFKHKVGVMVHIQFGLDDNEFILCFCGGIGRHA